jgi:hypothetical protein
VRYVSHGAKDFHPDEFGQQIKKSGPRPESTEGGSIVPDFGISRSRSATKTKRHGDVSDTNGNLFVADHNAQDVSDGSAISDGPETLADRIRKQMAETDGGNDEFLPSDQVEELINMESVSQELTRLGYSQKETLVRANDVTDIVSTPRGMSSRQRIFAILCLQEKAIEIPNFVNEDVFDDDLPFIFNRKVPGEVHRRPFGGAEKAVRLFRVKANWQAHELEYFRTSQGKLLAPYFEFSIGDNQKVLHYPLKNELVLPFIQDIFDEGGAKAEIGLAMHREGGYSVVRKVKIHPAHHNARPSDVCFTHILLHWTNC